MKSLEDFLELQDVSDMEEEIFINDRIGSFKVKPFTPGQHQAYLKRSKVKNGKDEEFSQSKFNMLIITNHIVEPNLNNADFLAKANCADAEDFINRKFKAGEVQELAEQICRISGFGTDANEDIEEAKN